MIRHTLTGEVRYRHQSRIFRGTVLVLQVQEHIEGQALDYDGYGPLQDRLSWRDAKVSDLTMSEGGVHLVVPRSPTKNP